MSTVVILSEIVFSSARRYKSMKYSWQKMQAPFLLPSMVEALMISSISGTLFSMIKLLMFDSFSRVFLVTNFLIHEITMLPLLRQQIMNPHALLTETGVWIVESLVSSPSVCSGLIFFSQHDNVIRAHISMGRIM